MAAPPPPGGAAIAAAADLRNYHTILEKHFSVRFEKLGDDEHGDFPRWRGQILGHVRLIVDPLSRFFAMSAPATRWRSPLLSGALPPAKRHGYETGHHSCVAYKRARHHRARVPSLTHVGDNCAEQMVLGTLSSCAEHLTHTNDRCAHSLRTTECAEALAV